MENLTIDKINSMIHAIDHAITDLCVQIEISNQHMGSTYQYTWRQKELRDIKQILKELITKCTQVHNLEM